MKKTILLFFVLISYSACQKSQQEIDAPLGDYQITNSQAKKWYVNSDISQWIEYNKAKNYYNQFDIIWYTEKSFDLVFTNSTNPKSSYKNTHRLECAYKLRANGKVVDKKINNKTVKALLKSTSSEDLKAFLGSEYSKIPKELSKNALLQFIWLKNNEYQKFYESSALDHQISSSEFLNLITQIKNMFGNILWFRAKQESFQKIDLGYSLDFDVGFVGTKTPINIHLQWNESMQIINFGLQSSAKNQTAFAHQLFRQFWTDAERSDWRKIYDNSSEALKNDLNIDDLSKKSTLLLNSGSEREFKLSSIEIDLSNHGKKWAYFYEFAKGSKWIGVNLYQNLNTVSYSLDKLVIVE